MRNHRLTKRSRNNTDVELDLTNELLENAKHPTAEAPSQGERVVVEENERQHPQRPRNTGTIRLRHPPAKQLQERPRGHGGYG